MITSVYLSNQTVQIAMGEWSRGAEKIHKSFSVDIAEGSLLNGMIINEQDLQGQMEEIWEQYQLPKQDVELVINGSAFSNKLVTVPMIKEKKILEMLPMEFGDVERLEDVVCDYMVIEENKAEKKQELMAVVADKNYIRSYMELFSRMGIRVTGITAAYCSIIKLLMRELAADGTSGIILAMDGNSLTSMLWINGKYSYATRKRIFSQRGTEGFGLEVVRNISTIQQFYTSLKSEFPLTKVLTSGFSGEDLSVCRDSLVQSEMKLQIESLAYEYADQAFAAGNLIKRGRDVNFCRSIREEKKNSRKVNWKLLLVPGIALALCTAVSGTIGVLCLIKNKQVEELEAYLENPRNQEMQGEYLSVQAANDAVQQLISQEEQVQSMLDSYPFMDSEVADLIVSCSLEKMEVDVKEYHADEGQVVLEVYSPDVNSLNQYVDALESTGIFRGINYQGYAKAEETGMYVVNMSCYLLASAGR